MRTEFLSHSPAETRTHAASLGGKLGAGSVIRLSGDLGAGKTEWVRGLAGEVTPEDEVTSPTFALLHEYRRGPLPIFHWDLYRLSPESDWSVLDLADHLPGPGITVVEWSERYPGPWPASTIDIQLLLGSADERTIITTWP